MMTIITKYISLAALLTLAACAGGASPPLSLSEKLEDKSPQEQQGILRVACLTEAEWQQSQDLAAFRSNGSPRAVYNARYYTEVAHLKAVCREMNKIMAER